MKKVLMFFGYLIFILISTQSLGQQFSSAQINSIQVAPTFNSEYQAYLDRLTALGYTLPSTGQKLKQNNLCTCIKNNIGPLKTYFDVIYLIANDAGLNTASVNLIYPSSFQITWVNSPTFTNNQGVSGNGTTSYGDTNFAWGTNGIAYTQNSAHRSLYVFTDTGSAANALDGSSTNSNLMISSVTTTTSRINQGTTNLASSVNLNGTGLVGLDRSSSTNITGFNSTIFKTTTATSSTTGSTNNQYILRGNALFGDNTISFYSMGAHLTNAQISNLNFCVTNYVNSL